MIPDQLPLSLPAGTRSKRRAVYAVGVVTLLDDTSDVPGIGSVGLGPGYIGNWQPIRVCAENPARSGASWIPARMIDWNAP